jgi:hypothetical protein
MRKKFYLSPKFQFDYETKRIYGLISHKFLRVGHENFDTSKIEAGFSFYETSYKKTQPWLILKAKSTNSLLKKIEYTPTLRLINNIIKTTSIQFEWFQSITMLQNTTHPTDNQRRSNKLLDAHTCSGKLTFLLTSLMFLTCKISIMRNVGGQ